MTSTFRKVTREELALFVARYPRPLERDVFAACDPPLVTFNDFTLGEWSASVVARHMAGDDRAPEHGWEIRQ